MNESEVREIVVVKKEKRGEVEFMNEKGKVVTTSPRLGVAHRMPPPVFLLI